LAKKYDLGVFIISPTDKGGHLHTPSKKMLELCKPLHPIVFNDLFCLRNQNVHTLSVGIAKEADFDLHLENLVEFIILNHSGSNPQPLEFKENVHKSEFKASI